MSIAEMNEPQITERINALADELADLYARRAGMLKDTRVPGRETGWCASCGRNEVACWDGEDTCSECAWR